MNCFVHLGFDPVPREVKNPASAIALAEAVLKAEKEEDPDSKFTILWRRDEFYPDNFYNYDSEQLHKELNKSGSVVLQLVNMSGDFPIMGESVTIFTAELEKKYAEQAESALEDVDEELDTKQIEMHGEGFIKRRTRSPKK